MCVHTNLVLLIFKIILFTSRFDGILLEAHTDASAYFSKYEIADCKILDGEGKRQNLKLKEREKRNAKPDAEILLKTSNKMFSLLLYEDGLFNNISIETQKIKNIKKKKDSKIKFYVGILKSKPLRSSVTGYINENVFSGYIVNENITYFIDSVNNFNSNYTHSQKVTIYQAEDINKSHWNTSSDSFINFSIWQLLHGMGNVTLNRTVISDETDLDNQKDDLYCEIEIVADHTLYNFFKKDMQKLMAYLYLHAKYADRIFRGTDFNMDGKPDRIRIEVAKISVYKTLHDANYPMVESLNIEQYLMKLLYRQQTLPFCLSISMSYLPFEGPAIGQAFKPDLTIPNFFSGICEKPFPNFDNETKLHFNVAAVNLRVGNNPMLPLAITLLAFTHELGHGFGGDHDPLTSHMCSPAKSSGKKYLMYPKTLQKSLQSSEFSPCSRVAIGEIIRMKGGCLKTRNATCGNAIREGEEECDCGPEATCNTIDPCCNPSDIKPPEVGCTLRKQKGYQCSAKESYCCTEDCSISNDTSLMCYRDSFLCLKSFCDGQSPECPHPIDSLPSCSTEAMVCNGSICNTSVCWQLGLQECFCWNDPKYECLTCCEKEEMCVPASGLGLFNSSGEPYVHREGTNCNYGVSHCDASGNCSTEKNKKLRFSIILLSLILISLSAIACLSVALYFARKKMNLGHLLLLRNRI